jgi:hypothetical protein
MIIKIIIADNISMGPGAGLVHSFAPGLPSDILHGDAPRDKLWEIGHIVDYRDK